MGWLLEWDDVRRIPEAEGVGMTHHPQLLINPSPYNLAAAALHTYRRDSAVMTFPHHTIEADGLLADIYLAPGNGLVIAVRGTTGAADWFRSLDAGKCNSDYLPGMIHRGFASASEVITRQIREWLITQSGIDISRARVWLAGHSLGGAIAIFLAPWMHAHAATIAGIHTYGAPRVGNRLYADCWGMRFGAVHRRHVNCADVVPHLPSIWMDYVHIAGLCYYDRHGDCRLHHRWYATLDKLAAIWRHIGTPGLAAIEYHDMATYLAVIRHNGGSCDVLGH